MQTRAPDEGPSSGSLSAPRTGSGPTSELSGIGKSDDDKLLRSLAKKHNIDSITSLVVAYNATTDKDERAVLFGWLCSYSKRSEACLDTESALGYSELARIHPRSIQDKEVLRNVVRKLCSFFCGGAFLEPNCADALHRALVHIDPSAYQSVSELLEVAKVLLNGFSAIPTLRQENFSDYEALFLALHQTIFALHNQKDIYEKEKHELRREIAEKERMLELSCKYYPVRLHFTTLRQAVERLNLNLEAVSPHLAQAKLCLSCGLCGFLDIFHFFRRLVAGDIECTPVLRAIERGRAAVDNMGVIKREWYDSLRDLMIKRHQVLKSETEIGSLANAYDVVMKKERETKKRDRKALRYGIIQEMRLLAIQGSYQGVRKEAIKYLRDLTTKRTFSGGWLSDRDLLNAFLDAARDISSMGEYKQEMEESIRKMQQSCKGHAKTTLAAWLGSALSENKIQEPQQCQAIKKDSDDVFVISSQEVGYVPLTTIRSNLKDLRDKYKHEDFATVSDSPISFLRERELCSYVKVPSLFEPNVLECVKDMEHHVVIYEQTYEQRTVGRRGEQRKEVDGNETEAEGSTIQERDDLREYSEQKRKVARAIPIADLFQPRSFAAGVDEREIRRVLLYGNPGSGKTCISKAIAHKWALGEILQEFEAIYVVPIRRLNAAKTETLAAMVAQICFKRKESHTEFEKLKVQVDDDLHLSSTLLIFDGLDEANEDARDLLSEAEKGECKLLILTRPYNLRGIRTRVDCEFECLGFDDRQLENYINKKLQEDEASRFIFSLQQDRVMWETAHTPVTAHILCSLSKNHGTSTEDQRKRKSMFQIYDDMTDFVWKRFEVQFEAKARTVNKTVVLGDLEKIAFEALKNGQILIEQRIVEHCATSTNASKLFKESGFLLLALEGQEYQFPHLTFQEYFAGRYIAKNLQNKRSDAGIRVLDFIREGKYDQKHTLTLSFTMHAFAQARSKLALQEMLSNIDEEPVEVLGIQHHLLRMHVLEATLEEADKDDFEHLLNDEEAIELVKCARRLLEHTIDHILIREIVIEKFQQFYRIFEGFPEVLDDVVDGVKNSLAYPEKLTWAEMEKIKDVLKIAKHSPKQSYVIIQFVLQLSEEPKGQRNLEECIRKLSLMGELMPQHAGQVLPMLAMSCGNEDRDVRQAAMEGIDRVIAVAAQNASKILPTLAIWCPDERADVREAAIKTIKRIVAGTPQQAGELLPTMAEWCINKHRNVRMTAIETIPLVVAAVPQLADEVLPTLVRLCGHNDCYGVRYAPTYTIGCVVAAAPHHAGNFLPMLAKLCDDEEMGVRVAASRAIGKIVAAAPQHASEYLPTLASMCGTENPDVSMAVMETIGCIVMAAPQQAGEYLSTMAAKCGHKDSYVRRIAITFVGHVVAAAPQHAGEYLPTLAAKCGDEDSDVRLVATALVGHVIATSAPQHACEYLPTLAAKCGDEDPNVRQTATAAVGVLVAEAAPQHAGEYLPTLAARYGDENLWVRSDALEGICHVVRASPQQVTGEVLPTLLAMCGEHDLALASSAAMDAICDVVEAAPHQAREVLPTLTENCAAEYSGVRRDTIEAIGRVVTTAPQYAGQVLPMLTAKCGHEDSGVRRDTIEAIGRVVTTAPQYAGQVLPMLAKGCADEDSGVRKKAMETIGRVVAAAPQYTCQLLPMLTAKCGHEDSGVRRDTIEAIGRVVTPAPQYAGEVLPMLAKGCVDENADVRSNAIKVIGSSVAAAPTLASEVLPMLAKGCVDENADVRSNAIKVIGSSVAAAPTLASEVLPMLAKERIEKNLRVRRNVIEAISRVVTAAPQHAGEVLLMLMTKCADEDSGVRKKAMETIGRVVTTAPQYAGEALPMLAKGCVDEDSDVRRDTIGAIGRVVAAAAQYAGEFLPMLAKGCADKDSGVRQKAMETIGRVVTTAPQYAGEALPMLATGCVDENEDVRYGARTAFNSIKPEKVIPSSVSFLPTFVGGLSLFFVRNSFTMDSLTKSKTIFLVLHTTHSQRIGRWDQGDIDRYVCLLTREFTETFPGLLDKPGISEPTQGPGISEPTQGPGISEPTQSRSKSSQKPRWWRRFRV